MTKQEQARIRNWNKARLMGTTFNNDGFTEGERFILEKIYELKNILLQNWDRNSVKVLGMTSKNYKDE